jgi:two-component system chemotaxis sensor kinase CheA
VSVSGHDERFRRLFAEEASGRLSRLGELLIQLEEAGRDEEVLASIFREAHTLKGAAAVVGMEEVSTVAHAMEDLLDEVRAGHREATSPVVDALLACVDGLTRMIPDQLSGVGSSDEASRLVLLLSSVPSDLASASARPIAPPPPPPVERPVTESPARLTAETVSVPIDRLDELVRLVGESAAAHLRVSRLVSERLGLQADTLAEFRDLSRVLNDLQERTMRARMVPVATITDSLHRAVRDLARALDKEVRWEVRGAETELDRGMLQQLAQPLMHLVRNAVDHGIETPAERRAAGKPAQASLVLHAMQLGSEVIITVTDDGRGIDVDRVREQAMARGDDVSATSDAEAVFLIFRSGLSTARRTTDVSGRGVGLDVVRSSVVDVRGRIDVRSEPGGGTEFRIIVPITLAVLPCLLVSVGGDRFAIPMHSVVVARSTSELETSQSAGRPVVWIDGEPIALSSLAATLGLPASETPDRQLVVLAGATRKHALSVDALLGQRDVVVKGLSRLLPRLDILAGASVEPDGSILLVLDALGTIDRARNATAPGGSVTMPAAAAPSGRRGSVLVVDDALTIRELQRSMLERAGFLVTTAGDGVEALARLAEGPFDLVLADLDMPRMDGFALTQAIREHPSTSNLPVLILTSRDGEEDRRRGLDAGADGYIVKSEFDERALLAAIERLLGRDQ